MSNKRFLWIILCFILLIALALFSYRFLTAAQNHTPPESERSVISAVSAADFTCYDAQGNQIGTALDNINNLEAGGIWKFDALGLEEGIASYRLVEISGF